MYLPGALCLGRSVFGYLDLYGGVYSSGSVMVRGTVALLLTCLGETNASRMGASICQAAEVEEMICKTPADYEQRAIYLATHPEALKRIRQRLQNSLVKPATYPPLFQVEGFVRSLESAFHDMWRGSLTPKITSN